jgi:hypothetical protein
VFLQSIRSSTKPKWNEWYLRPRPKRKSARLGRSELLRCLGMLRDVLYPTPSWVLRERKLARTANEGCLSVNSAERDFADHRSTVRSAK